MSFFSALDRLHALGAELAAPGAARRKFDLDHMGVLVRALGEPQGQFRAVLLAGTNGKGSTAATLAHILAAAGIRTGLYTSPHLVRVTERVRTNTAGEGAGEEAAGEADGGVGPALGEIGEEAFARLFFRVDETARALVERGELPHMPSYFETLTAVGFLYFAEQRVEVAVLEVGLGGRLDATNVVEPAVSVLTDIALDHQDYLGTTIREIAREKAGILRAGGVLVTLPQHPEANQAIGEAAMALGVRGVNAAEYLPGRNFRTDAAVGDAVGLARNRYTVAVEGEGLEVDSALFGEHQQRNLALAIATAAELRNLFGYGISNAAMERGIRATRWPGRLEFVGPDLLLDVAHNPAGAWTLRAALATLPDARPRTLVFSCLRDKDLREMAQILFPLFDGPGRRVVLTAIENPRAATLEQLAETARVLDVAAEVAGTPKEALEVARRVTPEGGLVVVTGSIYLVGTVRGLVV
jgi:dihydrofolate synthase/folylpolyglutamate synthase